MTTTLAPAVTWPTAGACCCRALLLGEASSAAAQAAAELASDTAAEYLQQLHPVDDAGPALRLPTPVRELLRVTAAGACELTDGELEVAAQHVCRAARRDMDGARGLATLLRYASNMHICKPKTALPTSACSFDAQTKSSAHQQQTRCILSQADRMDNGTLQRQPQSGVGARRAS